MDILIKGMEMPKSCEGCFACEEFSYECYDYCNILKAPTTRGEKRKDCPLVALPEHGRLIDADAFKNNIADMRMEKPLRNGAKQMIEIGGLFGRIIDDTPTIVEASNADN